MGLFDRFRKSAPATDEVEERDDLDTERDEDTGLDASDDAGADDDAREPSDLTDEDADDRSLDDPAEEEDEEDLAKAAPLDRVDNGPWDSEEEFGEENRIDLGALQIPVRDGMQVRLDAEEGTNRILAVTLVHQGGAVQLQAFAAPRSEGLWKSVRTQIRDNVVQKGGAVDELYTALGTELLTRIPVRTKDGKAAARVARFAGVDGPRWFVRAVFTGKAITDEDVRAELVQIFRGTVVHRGTEAMPPRDLLVLSQPTAVKAPAAPESADRDDIDPFERGPEITEVR